MWVAVEKKATPTLSSATIRVQNFKKLRSKMADITSSRFIIKLSDSNNNPFIANGIKLYGQCTYQPCTTRGTEFDLVRADPWILCRTEHLITVLINQLRIKFDCNKFDHERVPAACGVIS